MRDRAQARFFLVPHHRTEMIDTGIKRIALVTDFGAGLYVGQVLARLGDQVPGLPIIDLAHDLPPFRPDLGAYLLPAVVRDMPRGSLYLCVVDPGVGGDRRGLVVAADGDLFVGPDNGLLSQVARRAQRALVRRIDWRPGGMAPSFHGRDWFAPVAAALCRGEDLALGELTRNGLIGAEWSDDLSAVVYVDVYGNLLCGLRAVRQPPDAQIVAAGRSLSRARTFGEVPPGCAFWYENAFGLVEIAVNQGRADSVLGLGPGDPIVSVPAVDRPVSALEIRCQGRQLPVRLGSRPGADSSREPSGPGRGAAHQHHLNLPERPMANLTDVLGTFMQNAMSPSGESRIGNALNGLRANIGNMIEAQGGADGILKNVLDTAKSTLGSAAQNPAQAAGLGAVLGSVLGGGRSSISGAVKGGALAVLAGIAYQAFTAAGKGPVEAQSGGAPQYTGGAVPVGMKAPTTPAEEQLLANHAELVMRGMISAAKADGEVSADEIGLIVGKLKEAGLAGDAEAWIMKELRQPLDLNAFAAQIPNPEVAAQVYAASLLAIEVDTPQEEAYLADLAAKTGLDAAVVANIHQTLGVKV